MSLLVGVSDARSELMEFQFRGHASGTVNGIQFDTDYYLVATGNTADRVIVSSPSEYFYIDNTHAVITLDGLGGYLFLTPTQTWVSNFIGSAGISFAGPFGPNIITGPLQTPAFRNWDMLGPINEQFGLGGIEQPGNSPIQTSAGTLVLAPLSLVPVSFAARRVPEPSASLFGCTGLALMLMIRLSNRRRLANWR